MKTKDYRFWILIMASMVMFCGRAQNPDRPNIIYIFTDQQNASMMGSAGNEWLKTPAMDYIANNGVRFTRAYTTNPVCSPSRISLMTGRFPSYFETGNGERVIDNVDAMKVTDVSDKVKKTTIAAYLKKAGYDLVFGGKQHLPKPLIPKELGFKVISDNERSELAATSADFIRNNPGNPYFMVVSLINPHDICYMAIRDFVSTPHEKRLIETGGKELAVLNKAMRRPEGVSDKDFFENYAPPIPPNFEPQQGEPQAIKDLINSRNFRKLARENYSKKDWQQHRWAYCRLTETVDEQIQTILNALKETGQEENTLVIFSSDHGDMDSAHRMEHKSTLYEESANIPFMMMWKNHIPAGVVDSIHLVSNGLDLLPTVTDYAGLKGTSDSRGLSLRPLLEGDGQNWRKTLGVESEVGRMVVHEDGYKYIEYFGKDNETQLLDLNLDPYEKTHYTDSLKHDSIKMELNKEFQNEWFPKEIGAD